ncbi:878_t:CDS:2, partial [Dentiscutata erythropus]
MLAQIGVGNLKNRYLEDLNETHEFKEALELYVRPRGTWNVSIIKTLSNKEEMDYEAREGDIEEVVNGFLTSRNELTSNDKNILEKAAEEFLISKEKTSLIRTVNGFFVPENQLTLEDINTLNVAVNQFLALRDEKALKLLKIAMNEFLEWLKYNIESSKEEKILKNIICNFLESPFVLENKLPLGSKLALGNQITTEDVKSLKEASKKGRESFEEISNKLLALKAKEVLETAVNDLLIRKRKKVLLILGSGGTGKSTFNRYLARRLWEEYEQHSIMQPIPLFIALAPLGEFINQNKDLIEVYLQKEGISLEQINDLRKRKFVFILDGYDEIAERERHCYNSNMFSKWKNAKIIISCRPEYLGEGYEKRFWPKENEERGFQELTITPFSGVEIEQYINNYVNYSQKKGNPLTWDAETYVQQIKNMPQVEDLVCNPILLKITLTVLPGLLGGGGIITSQINRIVLYDEFIKKWFERAQERLTKIQLKPEEQRVFDYLNEENFSRHCLLFGKEFAVKMFVDNNKIVINYDPLSEETASDWSKHLGNRDEKNRLMRFSMPLIRRGNQYWFFHKSLRDYLIACALLDSFKDKPCETSFNKQSIIPEPAIQQFLVERVQQKPEYKQPMLNFIECSKKDETVQIASANAITVLLRAKIPLPINLNNIRIPGADLNSGVFNKSQLVRADLSNVNFQNAKLRSANLEGASLQDANLKGADLTGANLRHSNLQGVNLHDSYLKNVNLEGVNLRVQDFRGFDLRNTDFC